MNENGYYVNVVFGGVEYFDVYERWTNSGFACIYKEKYGLITQGYTSDSLAVRETPFWPLVSK